MEREGVGILDLPNDLFKEIIINSIDPRHNADLFLVCQQWNNMIENDDQFWFKASQKHFGYDLNYFNRISDQTLLTWKNIYLNTIKRGFILKLSIHGGMKQYDESNNRTINIFKFNDKITVKFSIENLSSMKPLYIYGGYGSGWDSEHLILSGKCLQATNQSKLPDYIFGYEKFEDWCGTGKEDIINMVQPMELKEYQIVGDVVCYKKEFLEENRKVYLEKQKNNGRIQINDDQILIDGDVIGLQFPSELGTMKLEEKKFINNKNEAVNLFAYIGACFSEEGVKKFESLKQDVMELTNFGEFYIDSQHTVKIPKVEEWELKKEITLKFESLV